MLCEAEERRGDTVSALQHLKEAVGVSKAAIRGGGGKHFLGLLAEALAHMSEVWGRLGDKRRAEGYALAASECLGDGSVPASSREEGYDSDETTLSLEGARPGQRGDTNCSALVKSVAKATRLLAMPSEKTVVIVEGSVPSASELEVTNDVERGLIVIKDLVATGDAMRRCSKVRWRAHLKLTFVANTSVHNLAASNFSVVSNVENKHLLCDSLLSSQGKENGFSEAYSQASEMLGIMRGVEFGELVEGAVGFPGLKEGRAGFGERLQGLKCQLDVRVARATEITKGWSR